MQPAFDSTTLSESPNLLVKPVVKWVGGKRQLISDIKRNLPITFKRYYEPFFGGGAVALTLQPKLATIGDFNEQLINLYQVIADSPEQLITDLRKHENTEEYFYEMRLKDRLPLEWLSMTEIEKASRFIFLNKTCFNGLYRVNNAGEFNAPFGRYKKPRIVDQVAIRALSTYLQSENIDIVQGDYENTIKDASVEDFIYLDPPYDTHATGSNFTGYTSGGFGRDEQERLLEVCNESRKKGAFILQSNAATDWVKENYLSHGYHIEIIKARRAVNSNGADRGEVDEVLIRNYAKRAY
jgi:DNA adenine methylase